MDSKSQTSLNDPTIYSGVKLREVADSEKNTPEGQKQQADLDEVPDGGWRAWLVVFGGFCLSCVVLECRRCSRTPLLTQPVAFAVSAGYMVSAELFRGTVN
jgi:hypothetical protein